jgi:chromate transporter
VVTLAPYYRRIAHNQRIKAFVDGVTAAAIGAIAGAAVVLGRRSILDLPTVLIAIAVFVILSKTKKVPEPALILVSGFAGLLIRGFT